MQKSARYEKNQDIAIYKMTDRWLEPKNDYKKLIQCPSLTRVDPVGYSIKIRSNLVERWFWTWKSEFESIWKWWRHEEMKMI